MKYGDTLHQRSVPQWAYRKSTKRRAMVHHLLIHRFTENVAYDSIKVLIKEHTTPGKGKAVAIPGQGDRVDSKFENELFDIFAEQHSNVNLFVRSKSGEI